MLDALGGGIAGVKGFRRAVAVGDRVGALLKDHDGGPVLVIVQPDMAAWLDLEHAKPELPAGHARNFRSEVDHHGLERRISFVALRVSCAAAPAQAKMVPETMSAYPSVRVRIVILPESSAHKIRCGGWWNVKIRRTPRHRNTVIPSDIRHSSRRLNPQTPTARSSRPFDTRRSSKTAPRSRTCPPPRGPAVRAAARCRYCPRHPPSGSVRGR